MDDQNHRKLPPDRPSDVLACGSNKKKKNADDQIRPEDSASQGVVFMEHEDTVPVSTTQVPTLSYKASLMGFNGIAHGGECMEEEELLSDTIDKEWDLPEPSEEVREMMKTHPVVSITAEEYSTWCKPWNAALILTVLGKRYNIYTLKAHLSRLWNTPEFDLVDLPNNYFIVRFLQKEGWGQLYQKALYGGPWVVQQHTLLVQKWSPGFDPFHNPLGKIATWVRIPNIPMQCYNKEFLTRLGNSIGRTLKTDLLTPSEQSNTAARIERGRYARICVELDLQKKLVSKVIAAHSVYHVEYEGLNLICFSCGRYGHRQENCQWTYTEKAPTGAGQPSKENRVVNPPVEKGEPCKEELFGAWMIAGCSQRNRNPRRRNQPPLSTAHEGHQRPSQATRVDRSSSRFDVLAELEEGCESAEQLLMSAGSAYKTADVQTGGDGERRSHTHDVSRARHVSHGGGQTWQVKQRSWANKFGPEQLNEASASHGLNKNGPKQLGQTKAAKTNGLSENSIGKRQNLVVGGNVTQMNSNPIGIGTYERRQQNNTILMLEGPVIKDTRAENPFIKEKCEKSYMLTTKNEGLLDPNNITLDEDIGDDFMTVKEGDVGHASLEQQDQRIEDISGM